jgi:bifunctional non-homologous end joining protein LigD
VSNRKIKADFIEPMLLLRTEKLPEGKEWHYELKLDGYRALAIKSSGKVSLRSRNDNDFNSRYPGIVNALAPMPDDTVIDGEVVALDENGRPSFNALQNYGSGPSPLHFFIFDILVLDGRDVMGEQLTTRRELIEKQVLPKLADPIRYSPVLEASLSGLIHSVKLQGLEGLVAKRRDSKYESGLRSGAWMSIKGRNWSSQVIPLLPRTSTPWSSGITRTPSLCTLPARGTASLRHHGLSCSGRSNPSKSRTAHSRICPRRRGGGGVPA